MKKQDLVSKLKADAIENKFALDGEYLVYDKSANLKYQPYGYGLTLGDLLTANPVSNTRINVTLLVVLSGIQENEAFNDLKVVASYRSPEYDLLNFGQSDSKLYTKGDGLALSSKDVEGLVTAVKTNFTPGELGIYKWGVHIGRTTAEPKEWDYRSDDSFKRKALDILINDKVKNLLLIGAAAAAGWFFFLRKK